MSVIRGTGLNCVAENQSVGSTCDLYTHRSRRTTSRSSLFLTFSSRVRILTFFVCQKSNTLSGSSSS